LRKTAASYRKARPDVRRMWNRAFFQTIAFGTAIADFTYEEPFAPLLGPHKGAIMVLANRYSGLARTPISPRRARGRGPLVNDASHSIERDR